jgi:hypothetical protein
MHTLLTDSRALAGAGGDRGPILSVAAAVLAITTLEFVVPHEPSLAVEGAGIGGVVLLIVAVALAVVVVAVQVVRAEVAR